MTFAEKMNAYSLYQVTMTTGHRYTVWAKDEEEAKQQAEIRYVGYIAKSAQKV